MIRRPKPPKHKRTRNELRKTAPNAVHEQNPAGTKLALKVLKRKFTKHEARTRLGLVTKLVTQEPGNELSLASIGDNVADLGNRGSYSPDPQT